MKNIFTLIFLTISVFSFGQTYNGVYGKYKHNWVLKINPDSTIILEHDDENAAYDEYSGTIRKINDTLFTINAKMMFAQNKARAIGDSVIYIRLDSTAQKDIQNIKLTYLNGNISTIPANGKRKITIPIDKKLFNSQPNENIFFLSVGHKNPLNNKEIKTAFKIGEEYCLELYSGWEERFNVVIKKNNIRKIGKGHIDNFILQMHK